MLDTMIEQHAKERRAADLQRVSAPSVRAPGRVRMRLARTLAAAAARLDPVAGRRLDASLRGGQA